MKHFLKVVVIKILTAEAALLLRRKKPLIIAVTGSVGKTSTKDAIYVAIKNHRHTRKSEKSFNSDIGLVLTVLGLPNAWNNPLGWLWNIVDGFFTALLSRSYPEVLILEAGIDRPGDMANLTRLVRPDIVVLTRFPNVPVHVEYFASPEAVIEEKMLLVSALNPDGTLIYNSDDQMIVSRLGSVRQKKIGFSRQSKSDFVFSDDRVVYKDDRPMGVVFTVTSEDSQIPVAITGTIGLQFVYACTAALAVAKTLGVAVDEAASALADFSPPRGRMRIVSGIKSALLIDDTYNSSPVAAEQALLALSDLKYAKRKIVVLGDMMELGSYSAEEHRKLGLRVPAVANILITVGVRSHKIAEGAMAAGMSDRYILHFDDVAQAGRELQQLLAPGDAVLVKASQSVRAERIVEEVMSEPERAGELLVRQDDEWRKR